MELKINLDNSAYGTLAAKLLPLLPEEVIADSGLVSGFLLGSIKKQPGILKSIIDAMSDDKKEELLVSLLNQNSSRILEKLNGLAGERELPLHLSGLHASK